MRPILLSLYGPIAIHSFGVMIALALIITFYLLDRDQPLQQLLGKNQLSNLFQISIVAGVVGGRIWFLCTNTEYIPSMTNVFAVWNGGLSILGAFIGIITTVSCYLYIHTISVLRVLDRLALYAPLTQAISRFGCFFAGCCYGIPTTMPWAIIYTDNDSLAPLHQALHPTQLYSSIMLTITFMLLVAFNHYKAKKPGQLLALYIMLMSTERFFIDFLRGDREFFEQSGIMTSLSIQQILAFILFLGALCMIITIQFFSKHQPKNLTFAPDESI